MAFLEVKNVKIVGISVGVPSTIERNNDKVLSNDYDTESFVEITGVKERRISKTLTTSDLCYAAAERLIENLSWGKEEIDAIILVSQNTDYYLPATACILQDRLGLKKECYALDITLGCSGWVYGLSTISALMSSGTIKKALLMSGDAKRHVPTYDPLFGFAGSVTALEYEEGNNGFKFHFGTDGSCYDAIIIPDGGSRNQITEASFAEEEIDGKTYNRLQTRMKGMDVFAFGITTAPKSIKKMAEYFKLNYLDYDYYVFHQANMKMNNIIARKLNLDLSKVPSSMCYFGNTSSASIPLTILSELKGVIDNKRTKFLCCGFGVGLSWGTVAFETDRILLSDLVEVDDCQINNRYVV
jgi:3-oxoacyl-[acyl-carrier-protein] synthase III